MNNHSVKHRLPIVERNHLEWTDLMDVLKGKILALRVFPFAHQKLCRHWVEQLSAYADFSHYSNAPDVGVQRTGFSLFEALNDPELLEKYYRMAAETPKRLKQIFSPFTDPICFMQAKLQAIWWGIVRPASVQGRQMNPGMLRRFPADDHQGLPPHQDLLEKDLPDIKNSRQFKGQLAANLYIEVPQEGGELELWDFAPAPDEARKFWKAHHDFMDRERLPVEPERIRPRPGELILFPSRQVHAVAPSSGGFRTAASFFIGYRGQKQSLEHWV